MPTKRGEDRGISLLRTKVFIPGPRKDLIHRQRLIDALRSNLLEKDTFHRKLTLISAPAGFGKTTLLSEWIQSIKMPVAWLSLDRGDNNLFRFLSYLIAAFQTINDDMGIESLAIFQSSTPPSVEAALTMLINEIARSSKPNMLILDDYHVIGDRSIHEAITFLLDHAPPNLHLVISSRSDPPLHLSRLRGRGELKELRTADLRFTAIETAAFLNDVMGLALSPEDVSALALRTEGWAVGLQLAALSIKSPFSPQARTSDRVSDVSSFATNQRYILDYFTDEVLLQQPEEIQDFLLQTAILDHLSAPLCNSLTGRSDGQRTLERLEKANLFITALDHDRHWYRYHHLFADLLRKHLKKIRPGVVAELHRRAGTWFEKNGLVSEAIKHWIASGDTAEAVRIVEGNALAMMDHGELITLSSWLDELPDQVVRSRPLLCIARAWPMAYAGQVQAVESLLQDAENSFVHLDEEIRKGPSGKRIQGHIAAIHAQILGIQGELARGAELVREALAQLPDDDLVTRGWAQFHLGFMLRMLGEFHTADQAFDEAIRINRATGRSHVVLLVLCERAALRINQGQLHRAEASCREAIALADAYVKKRGLNLPAAGHAFLRLSGVLREWNQLEEAIRQARRGLELCTQWGQADGMLEGYLHLARALHDSGDEDGAQNAMRKAKQIAMDVSPWFESYTAARQARLWLMQGKTKDALLWAESAGVSIDDDVAFKFAFNYLVLARLLIVEGSEKRSGISDETLDLVARILDCTEAIGADAYVIEALILQAMAFQTLGDDEHALVTLERALKLAEPEGYIRSFIGEGDPMENLLRKAIAEGIVRDYADRLVEALRSDTRRSHTLQPTILRSGSPSADSFEPPGEELTDRERQVLRLINAGLSNREIAEELFLSINTVKTHTKSLYRKLDVSSRTQAMNRAKELGIL
ncbi:MAG TPA: winged helix-turn-helix transcriptional regulator [Anaerolineae bacterium]|nr:winged helix-turn-helix transcriptional regulator [Anaerolineae bacterium]